MLRQEIESYQIIIRACAHNKDNNKQNDDTWWWTWAVDWYTDLHAVANGGHGSSKGFFLSEYMAGLYYVP